MIALLTVMMLALPMAQDADSRQLLKLEDDWARALMRRDTATFQRLLAPGFVYSENDQTMTRDEVLRGIVTGPDTVDAAANEDMKVHRFGTTALVTGWLVVRGKGPSGSFERRYRYTDTWMKRGKQWQIVGAHDYLAPPPKT
ncbi:MAG TPA: nuclear transport factor 2 family protein [Gemmatimonadales bacterium]|nr:nuclear transport factor 2 family protein [Gemmatimonadales bacterium]